MCMGKRRIHISCHFFALALVMALGSFGLLLSAGDAFAAARTDAMPTATRSVKQIVVPRGETIDTVISIGHPVVVQGTVTDSIIAFAADVIVEPGARAALILDVGGRVQQAAGARVTEGVVTIGRDQPILTTLAIAIALSAGAYLLWAFISALLFLYAAIAGLLLRKVDRPISAVARADWRRLMGVGLLWTLVPLVCAAASLVVPSLWAVTLLLTTLVTLLAIVGVPFAANTAGRSSARFLGWQDERLSSVAGALSMAIGINIPVVGLLVCLSLWLYAVGIAALLLRKPRLLHRPTPPSAET